MDKRIRKTYDIIRRRFRDKILLEELANEVELSSFHFHRLFKQEMNETPIQCLNRIRMERAMHLMVIDSSFSVTDIAEDCGFTSLSSFSRSFSKTYKKSPSEFLKSLNQLKNTVEPRTNETELSISNPNVVYFPGCWIFYSDTSIYFNNLMDIYDSVKAFCYMEEIQVEESAKMLGVFTHIHHAFSNSNNDLNYYAGIEINDSSKKKYTHRIFWIPEGKYACFTTTSSYFDLYSLLMEFKTSWLDKKPLMIKDPFAFECISENTTSRHYPNIKRTIYIPVS